MAETREFLVPDYFPDFSCKMGLCRRACCEGWRVSVPMRTYFSLLGLSCGEELRHRIDSHLCLCDTPTEDEYAFLAPRYDGNCPLRAPDGRCQLQIENGEDVLPEVCRLYPRGVRFEDGTWECSCAGSCEAVLELLFDDRRTAPLRFVRMRSGMVPPGDEGAENTYGGRKHQFETYGRQWEIRSFYIALLQDRRFSLPHRLLRLGDAMAVCRGELLASLKEDESVAAAVLPRLAAEESVSLEADRKRLAAGLEIAKRLLGLLDERSDSIRMLGEEAIRYFGCGGCGDGGAAAEEKYLFALRRLEELFPSHPVYFEHMMVNHMFFSVFPYQDRPDGVEEEYVALCAVYGLLRFLCLGNCEKLSSKADLADVCAAAFRLVEHAAFDRYAGIMLRHLGCAGREELAGFLSL